MSSSASFWQSISFPSAIDDILKKSEFTLQDLLDEDEVVVEARNQKQELLNYLTQPHIMTKLIGYIVDDPPPEAEEKVRTRYPVVACEIICSEVPEIDRVLMKSPEHLGKIYSFFDRPNINFLLANLVVKVLGTLLSSKIKDSLDYLKANPKWIDCFLNHLDAAVTIDFFNRLINIDAEPDGEGTLQWLVSIGFVEKVIGKLTKENSRIHNDVAQTVIDIMTTANWDSPLTERLTSEASCKQLLQLILDPNNPTAFPNGMRIFNKMLKNLLLAAEETFDSDEEDSAEEKQKPKRSKPNPSAPLDELPPVVQLLVKNISTLCELLKTPTKTTTITTQSLQTVQSFGFHRLTLMDVVDSLLNLNYDTVQAALADSPVFSIAIDLLFQFEHNNFCHRQVARVLTYMLEHLGSEGHQKFLAKTRLPHRLVEAEPKEQAYEESGNLRRQYRPYLYDLANSLHQIGEASEPFKQQLEAVPGWAEYDKQVQEERRKLQAMSGIEAMKTEEEPTVFQSRSSLGLDAPSENTTYEEGRDADDEDLSLSDDIDMDSTNDADDYDVDHAEILLSKQEIEAFA